MKAIAPIDFSHLIAFLLPGFVAFYALIYVSPRASQLVSACLAKDTGAGAWLILLLASLATGIVVSAFRGLVVDEIQFRTGVDKPDLDYSKLKDEHILAAFNEAVANAYRFAQFSGNMLVAILLFLGARLLLCGRVRDDWLIYTVLVATVIVLFFSHRGQLDETYKKLKQILA